MNNIHRVKILPIFFKAIIQNRKPFEIRKNDRNYKIGDDVILHEWENEKFTGRFCIVTIKEIFDISFIAPEYIAFTFDLISLGNLKYEPTKREKNEQT